MLAVEYVGTELVVRVLNGDPAMRCRMSVYSGGTVLAQVSTSLDGRFHVISATGAPATQYVVFSWTEWRTQNPNIAPDLSGADLSQGIDGCNLSGCNLRGCNLRGLDLRYQDLGGVDLSGADLTDASLIGANLSGADLTGANLAGADLGGVKFVGANLTNANLTDASLVAHYADTETKTDVAGVPGTDIKAGYRSTVTAGYAAQADFTNATTTGCRGCPPPS